MSEHRRKTARINVLVSLGCQILVIICGLITPRFMLNAYGSDTYGLVTSIAQFLGYVTLLEGGIGGVARAALYKPLASNDNVAISKILVELKRFFRIVAYIFIVYVVLLATNFNKISHTDVLDWTSTFILVVVISISTFGQYFIGISYAVLIQAAQRIYITNLLSIIVTVLNTLMVIILIKCECSIIAVKFVSSIIFLIRPIALWYYVKRHYELQHKVKRDQTYLNQKWSGLGQHIAYFLHSNTDIVILTIFSSMSSVAVYAIYNMVVSNIKNLTMSFHAGMEAVFGDMLAKNEIEELHKSFSTYEMIISMVSIILFSVTSIMIIPFVKLYTQGINDTNYVMPVFAILLILTEFFYCLRTPYHSVTVAAGHFKKTQSAAYGEAFINIILSIILVTKFDLVGITIATLVSIIFRFLYYVYYLSNNIMKRKVSLFYKRILVNAINFSINIVIGTFILNQYEIANFFNWIIVSIVVTMIVVVITIITNYFSYRYFFYEMISKRKNKYKV